MNKTINSFKYEFNNKKFKYVISNPPYICSQRIKYLMRDIRDFEPLGSLDGGLQGLDCIKKVIIAA